MFATCGAGECRMRGALRMQGGGVRLLPPSRSRRAYGKRETVAINFRIDAELKYQLEEIKYRTHRSSVTDILVEAINDVVKKYSV